MQGITEILAKFRKSLIIVDFSLQNSSIKITGNLLRNAESKVSIKKYYTV